ncbi:MAG: hypothetical protein H0V25_00850 [Solirubrobacterales bacterium]|nr:hypothetical protein [Solirubrobacterales bacterium]
MDSELISLLTVPLFTGVIGYVTNWTGVLMLFYPVHFRGINVPGLRVVARFFPRKVRQVPLGFTQGGIGWQGIVPSRAAKMGSIAVDKGIAKLGSQREFYESLDPDAIAEHIVESSRDDIRALVERTMQREQPGLWNDLPPRLREAVQQRVQDQLPDIVRTVTDGIGRDIDHLMDIKLMVIRHLEERPELANRIFLEIGEKELRFIRNFGFWFGLLLGIPTAIVTVLLFPVWWLLPVFGVLIGYVTNLVAIVMIFEPVEERRILGFRVHGLFLRRQREVAGIYSKVIAEDIVNLTNIGHELLEGRQSDRTRKLIVDALRPAIDRATGYATAAVRVAVGTDRYDSIRESVATEAVDYTLTPLQDPEFNAKQSAAIERLITDRMEQMSSEDFSEMLRTVIKEDEWLLYLHGAVLGFGAGLVHLALFG